MPVLSNQKHEKFASGVASGLSASESYVKAGYSKGGAEASASRLLRNAKVRARVAELSAKVTEQVIQVSIANRNDRLSALNERWLLMRQVRKERSAEMMRGGKALVPGAGTGLLARTVKIIGSGPRAKMIAEFVFDAALAKEERLCEEHAAKELGQWLEKAKEGSTEAQNFLWQLAQQMADGPAKAQVDKMPDETE